MLLFKLKAHAKFRHHLKCFQGMQGSSGGIETEHWSGMGMQTSRYLPVQI